MSNSRGWRIPVWNVFFPRRCSSVFLSAPEQAVPATDKQTKRIYLRGAFTMTEVKRRRRLAAPAGIAPSEPERDILDQYLYEVSTYPLLKGNEEIMYFFHAVVRAFF